MTSVIIFFIITLCNVMLSTVKSILTIKGTPKVSAFINTIYYSFYTIVLQQIVAFPIEIAFVVTAVGNAIGVYTSKIILEHFRKEDLWKISVTAQNEEIAKNIIEQLNENNLSFRVFDIEKKSGRTKGIDIFSETQKESEVVSNILKKYQGLKYHVTVAIKEL